MKKIVQTVLAALFYLQIEVGADTLGRDYFVCDRAILYSMEF